MRRRRRRRLWEQRNKTSMTLTLGMASFGQLVGQVSLSLKLFLNSRKKGTTSRRERSLSLFLLWIKGTQDTQRQAHTYTHIYNAGARHTHTHTHTLGQQRPKSRYCRLSLLYYFSPCPGNTNKSCHVIP
jgi:hypothetical protein